MEITSGIDGYGYGKAILFGEHFVVYGLPGIAGGISRMTTATAKKSEEPGLFVIDNRPAVEGYKAKKESQFQDSLNYIKDAIKKVCWDAQGIEVELAGNLIAASGVGASAAACAAIARAISKFFVLDLSEAEINDIAYQGERGYHGNPSGLDNTCATYGSLITFKRTEDGNQINQLDLDGSVGIVMANTGIPVDTKAIVDGVRERKEANEKKFEKIFYGYSELYGKALPALKSANWESVGHLMDENHKMLQEIGVSCKELDDFCKIAKKAGALGAKLTGGGQGGYMLALTPDSKTQDEVAMALSEKSELVIKTSIGGKK